MICKGEVYKAQLNAPYQQGDLMLVVSGDASNHSEAATVTVLGVMPRRGDVEPEIEAAFEFDGEPFKVWPFSLLVIPKAQLETTPLGRVEGLQLAWVDAILAVHFGLSPAGLEASAMMTIENGGETL